MTTIISPARHHFRLEVRLPTGKQTIELERNDFHRALEAVCFEGLRQHQLSTYDPPYDSFQIIPLFSQQPRTKGFRIVVDSGCGKYQSEFGVEYFHPRVKQLLNDGLDRDRATAKTLTASYLLSAFEEPISPKSPKAFGLESESPAVPITHATVGSLQNREHWDQPTEQDIDVLVARGVIEDSSEAAKQNPDREVGGLLLGHVRRDRDNGAMFVQVTSHVPAEDTVSTAVSITFTPQTWSHARSVAQHRSQGEIIVGWVHSHPFSLCSECPVSAPKECIDKVLFYSEDDRFVMQQLFHQPFMVGLLTSIEPRIETALGHPPVRLFGWRNCRLIERGFTVYDEDLSS